MAKAKGLRKEMEQLDAEVSPPLFSSCYPLVYYSTCTFFFPSPLDFKFHWPVYIIIFL